MVTGFDNLNEEKNKPIRTLDNCLLNMEHQSLDQGGQETYRDLLNKENDYCPKCGTDKIITDYGIGEVVCGKCGYVVEKVLLNTGPE